MAGRDGLPVTQGVTAQAKIPDLLYYRVWLEARKYRDAQPGPHGKRPNEQRRFPKRDRLPDIPRSRNSTGHDMCFMAKHFLHRRQLHHSPQLPSELLAPEVLAGNRMDLNRPFGDGKDNTKSATPIPRRWMASWMIRGGRRAVPGHQRQWQEGRRETGNANHSSISTVTQVSRSGRQTLGKPYATAGSVK